MPGCRGWDQEQDNWRCRETLIYESGVEEHAENYREFSRWRFDYGAFTVYAMKEPGLGKYVWDIYFQDSTIGISKGTWTEEDMRKEIANTIFWYEPPVLGVV